MSKLDPQLRNLLDDFKQGGTDAARAAQETHALRRAAPGERDPTPKVGVFIKYSGDIAELEVLGFETVTNLGTIATGFVPVDKIDDIAVLPNVTRIEISRPLYPELDVSMPEIQANSVHTGSPAFKGTGVIVGVIDTGIDYRHLSFRNADGTSRILAIWDQSSGLTGSPPTGFPIGVEYTKAQIDAALATATPLTSVPHQDTDGHGTHVAGIAAGNGLAPGNCRGASTFVGVAPEADLIVVNNRSETEALGESLNLVMAVDYIFQKAAALSKPAVINLSQGDNIGPHDGTSLVEQSLDILLSQPGRAMIKSAGNEGARNRHASGTVANGATEQVRFSVPAGQTGNVILDLWYGGSDRFACTITPPGGTTSATVNPGSSQTITLSNNNVAVINSTTNNPDNGDNRINIELRRGTAGNVQANEWRFDLTGTTVTNGEFHCWIERDSDSIFTSHNNNQCTISIPGTSHKVIAAGSYITKGSATGNLSDFSSRGPTRPSGPTRASRTKPEITAPGEAIMSARSASLPTEVLSRCSACCIDAYYSLQGTSMSAPHVTGIVALMLQKNSELTQDDIRTLFANGANVRREAMMGALPNANWGSGKISAALAVNAVTPASRSLSSTPPTPENVPELRPSPLPGGLGDAPAGGAAMLPLTFERLQQIQNELLSTVLGQQYAALIGAHLDEIRTLVNTNKRVATVWHRSGGPLLVQQIMQALEWPDRPLPTVIAEQSVAERVRRILAIFRRYASPALAAAIDQYAAAFLQLDGLSYNQLLRKLRAST